ncbi:MAG TPA: DUF4198 domain-containing protein [Longimicrobiaceae bacterium]|nr:DUF4198 domain-containing protein [Longimicrobiaceae bacterium]
MRPVSTRHRAALGLAAAAVLVLAAGTLSAHDFWLVPDAFQVADGGQLRVHGQTSSEFPTSESAVTADRVADARVIGATGEERIRDLSRSGTSLVLRHQPRGAGQRVVAVRLHPRSLRESVASFRRYVELEGAPEALSTVDRMGRPATDSLTRRYAKYAKTLVEVGRNGPRAFDRVAGHPLEFVPLQDPSSVGAGGTLPVRLLYRGRPLAGARVHAEAAPEPGREQTGTPHQALETDAEGVARVRLGRGGLWNVRTLQIVPADPGSGADWDAHWATLVWQAPGGGAEARGVAAAQDSAAVAETVDRYHRALAAGDSAAALALLTPDAVILESGGMETRAEYRSHHLPADIAFARAVPRERGPIHVSVRGDAAWATSTSVTQGRYRERDVNSVGAELMVLVRTPEGWRIAAIHWSSRNRR